ncbi:SseB family protein [Lysinibacter cavernae]|uniref:SseB protein N-terminal domain-containing protein n=1 Tax=Lysinibacter cavernae TaxID=1640652 RepID=A0A7X5TTA2_9MICO|nr:SseB family protein [Lysinibacter cavernae]NIH53289.1 hypothetical protein [Lysinibacter cavernae]
MGLFSRNKKTTGTDAQQSRAGEQQSGAGEQVQLIHHEAVEAALAQWSQRKDAQTMNNVLRQCAFGSLLLDGSDSTLGAGGSPFEVGSILAIGYKADNDGRKLLLAFTSNEELAKYRTGTRPNSFGQPAPAVLAQAMTDYDGIAINPGSPDLTCIMYSAEIERGLTSMPSLNERLKSAMMTNDIPWPHFVQALASTPTLYVAALEITDEAGNVTGMGSPTVTGRASAPGQPEPVYSLAFTSPAEVFAWHPAAQTTAVSFADISTMVADSGRAGVLVNPAGEAVAVSAGEFLQR